MAITLNDSVQNNSPKPLDNKLGRFLLGAFRAYDDIAEANSTILSAYRSRGLTVLINEGGTYEEYWYRQGTADSDLVRKAGLSVSGPLSYNTLTRGLSISQANTTTPGFLSATDWNTFNSKQNPITWGAVTAGSSKITLGGVPTSSVNSAFSIDVNESNLSLNNIGGTLGITKGGTGQTTATLAINALLPSQTGNGTKYLYTDGANISWQIVPPSGDPTVVTAGTNISVTGTGTVANPYVVNNTAAAQVNSDWTASSGVAQILNKPSLAAVATTGVYNDLTGKPTIPAAQVPSDWTAVAGVTRILNKPTLALVSSTGDYNDLINRPTIPNPDGSETKLSAGANISITGSGTIASPYTITASFASAPVSSVFGRTGTVVAVSGDYNTSQVTENTNLYFTNSRARSALSAGTGISYNSTTGAISSTITQADGSETKLSAGIGVSSITGSGTIASPYVINVSAGGPWTIDGSKIYYTGGPVGIGDNNPGESTYLSELSLGATGAGVDFDMHGAGYSRMYFRDTSQGTDLKNYEMLNYLGQFLLSRLNDANTARSIRLLLDTDGTVSFPSYAGGSTRMVTFDTTGKLVAAALPSASGTVTSVALVMPSYFSVSGSPVTTNGTLTVSYTTQTANLVLAGPTGGGPTAPTFRSLVNADIPNLTSKTLTTCSISGTTGIALGSDFTGDTWYRNSSGNIQRLAIGFIDQILTSTGSSPQWSDPATVRGHEFVNQQTSNALGQTQTIYTYAVPSGNAGSLVLWVVGTNYAETGDDSFHARLTVYFSNNGSGSVVNDTEYYFATELDLSGASVDADVASGSVRVRVHGVTGQTIRWRARVEKTVEIDQPL